MNKQKNLSLQLEKISCQGQTVCILGYEVCIIPINNTWCSEGSYKIMVKIWLIKFYLYKLIYISIYDIQSDIYVWVHICICAYTHTHTHTQVYTIHIR